MVLAETAELAIRINLEGNAARGVAKLNKQLGGLDRGVSRAGRGVGQIGAGLTRAGLLVGGAAITGLTAAAKAAIDFEDAFAGVRKTVDETELAAAGLSFEELAKSFRTMATEIPIAATEFAAIGETAGALGIAAGDIEEFTKTVALLGVTTNLTSEQAADDFGRLGTILGLTGDDFTELADSIVALGNAGASTESEITDITKRFAATAKQAGLTKEQMVGLASATASLGFEPERGGTALARVFANMATNISTANKKGVALGKGLGRSIKDMQRDIDRGEGLTLFMDVLETIRDMKPTQAARFLKDIGVTNVSDRTIFLAMSQQLPEINRQLGIAQDATGALSTEATKRFNTIASKVQLFKNNLVEAGIAIGTGMLPAIGRATDKLIAFLKLPSTQTDLKKLGEDIGQALDDIDWDEVLRQGRELVGVLKGALGFAKRLFDAFNALPGPIKEATAGFLVLDKLSSGLISSGAGNILSGLGETFTRSLGSRLPKVGALFAQPVFVTNWPPGFGAPGGGGGGGKPTPRPNPLENARSNTQRGFRETLRTLGAGFKTGAGVAITGDLLRTANSKLDSILQAARANKLPTPLPITGRMGGMSPDERQQFNDQKTRIAAVAMEVQRQGERQRQTVAQAKTAIDASKQRLAAVQAETKRETSRGVVATQAAKSATTTGASRIVGATNAQTSAIVGALYATRVTVQSVTKNTTIVQRYGPSNGSSGRFGQ